MNLEKSAKGAAPEWALVPFSQLMGRKVDITKFPGILPKDWSNDAKASFWHTLGTIATGTAAIAIAKMIGNATQEKKFDEYKDKLNTNKVNALHSYNAPNSAPQVAGVSKVRSLGISNNDKKKDEEKKEEKSVDKTASAIEKEAGVLDFIVPSMVGIPAAVYLGMQIDDVLTENRAKKLDKEIIENRNKLDALYAQLLTNIKKSNLKKHSSAEDLQKVAFSGDTIKELGAWLLVPPAVAMGMAALAAYRYTEKRDKNRMKVKVLKERVLPKNLTNAPAEVQILLGKDKKIPTDIKEQTYIEE